MHRGLGGHRSVGPDVDNYEKGPRMPLNEIWPGNAPSGLHRTATDRAVAAVERMMDASSRVGNAYADAYQEAVMNLADLGGNPGDRGPAGRLTLVTPPGNDTDPLGAPLRDATKTVTRLNERLLAASRELSLAYMDAYEEAVLCGAGAVAGAGEAASSNGASPRPDGSMRHGIGCEITRAYVDAARRMLS